MSTKRDVLVLEDLPAYILHALHRVGLSRRTYQRTASLEALRILRRGKNAEINLPPGTGKTLITQIIACIWLEERITKEEKVLCIVPSSALQEQHYYYCEWWASDVTPLKPLEVNSEWLANTK